MHEQRTKQEKISRVAVVTGGAQGIGGEAARMLALAGHRVVIADADAAALDAHASRIAELGATHPVQTRILDVRDAALVAKTFASIAEQVGGIDILVNSVGGSTPATSVDEISDDAWHATFRLNVDGTFFCTRAVVPGMKERGWGRIVNVSSVAGRTRSLFGGAQYTASKAAIIGFTRQLAYDLGRFGITANVVAPGVTLSARVERRWAEKPEHEREKILGLIPIGRAGRCDEVAAAIAFFCSEDAGYITGATLDANGGLHID